jgi:hypothetical protein
LIADGFGIASAVRSLPFHLRRGRTTQRQRQQRSECDVSLHFGLLSGRPDSSLACPICQ